MSKALLDALAYHGMTVRDFKSAWTNYVDENVTERPPKLGQHYKAFVVHPRKPGPQTLAIGHREDEQYVVDLLRDGLTIAQAAELVKAYGINKVTGDESDGDNTTMLQAVAGLVNILQATL